MSGVSDFFGKAAKGLGEYYETVFDVASKVTKHNPFTVVPASREIAPKAYDDAAEFAKNEITDKADLRGAEAETFLKGFPFLGGILNGLEGINLLEDLYRRTGKIPEYPGLSTPGASGIANSIGQLTRKIEDGTFSLHEFYSGDPEVDPTDLERMSRYMNENWNVRRGAL